MRASARRILWMVYNALCANRDEDERRELDLVLRLIEPEVLNEDNRDAVLLGGGEIG